MVSDVDGGIGMRGAEWRLRTVDSLPYPIIIPPSGQDANWQVPWRFRKPYFSLTNLSVDCSRLAPVNTSLTAATSILGKMACGGRYFLELNRSAQIDLTK